MAALNISSDFSSVYGFFSTEIAIFTTEEEWRALREDLPAGQAEMLELHDSPTPDAPAIFSASSLSALCSLCSGVLPLKQIRRGHAACRKVPPLPRDLSRRFRKPDTREHRLDGRRLAPFPPASHCSRTCPCSNFFFLPFISRQYLNILFILIKYYTV